MLQKLPCRQCGKKSHPYANRIDKKANIMKKCTIIDLDIQDPKLSQPIQKKRSHEHSAPQGPARRLKIKFRDNVVNHPYSAWTVDRNLGVNLSMEDNDIL